MAARGMIKEAIGLYNMTLSLDSTNSIARIQLARLLKRESRFRESLQHFEWLLKNDTTNFYLWEQVGDCSMRIDSIGKGLQSYNKSFELNSANMPMAVKLINALLQTGMPPMFYIEIANAALEHDSTYVPLIRAKGYLHFLSQDYQNSELWFSKAYELADSSKFTLKFLGISKFHKGSFYSSIFFLEKAYMIDTTDKALNFVYAKSLIEIGERNKAIEILDLTEKVITPSNEELGILYATKADAYFRGQVYANAIEQFTKAFELNPNQLEYLFEIGICHFNSNNLSTSLSVLNRFLLLAEVEQPIKVSTSRRISSAKLFITKIEKELFFLDQ
jgi:tetratricopeptide (TPR) repeat protein